MTHTDTADAELAGARVRQLTDLTERLSTRLSDETAAFEARRPQDVAAGLAETQEMANLYRRDTAHVKANPALLSAAPLADRTALIDATRLFEQIVSAHGRAVEAARIISEGLLRAIAEEAARARPSGAAYGAGGAASAGDGRAFALNRTA